MITVDKELASKWVDALRSGKYQQCNVALHNQDGFCCLGVLADIIEPNQWTRSEKLYGPGTELAHPLQFESDEYLDATKVVFVTDSPRESPDHTDGAQQTYAHMNDDGYSFEEIASRIAKDFGVE